MTGRMPGVGRRFVAALVSTALCGSQLVAQPLDPSLHRAEAVEQLATLSQSAERARFDTSALLASLADHSITSLFGYVRDFTQLAPYRGLLRGSKGVLLDSLGNSLDRALLLAELLRETGRDVRLVRAELSEGTATALFKEAAEAWSPAPFRSIADMAEEIETAFGPATGDMRSYSRKPRFCRPPSCRLTRSEHLFHFSSCPRLSLATMVFLVPTTGLSR